MVAVLVSEVALDRSADAMLAGHVGDLRPLRHGTSIGLSVEDEYVGPRFADRVLPAGRGFGGR
jgi:hypothetical protein